MLGSGTKVAQAVLLAELRKNGRTLASAFSPPRRFFTDFSTFERHPFAFDPIASGHPADTSGGPFRT
jgi:hypothetical protein